MRSVPLPRAVAAAAGVATVAVLSIGLTGTASAAAYDLPTEATLSAPSTVVVGEVVTFDASVIALDFELSLSSTSTVESAISIPDTPSGELELVIDGESVDSAELDPAGTAAWATDDLSVGTHSAFVVYEGDDFYAGTESDEITFTVTEPVALPRPSGSYTSGSGSGTDITVSPSGQFTVVFEGWNPNFPVKVTLHSDPVVLGNETVGLDGRLVRTYTLPAGTVSGAHRVVLEGVGFDGLAAIVTLTLQVPGEASAATPAGAATPAAAPAALSFTG